ncbi:hypothetical protein AXW37_16805 [Yersinia ruckeri]|nr:hypothetical protein BI323_13005 [Yersinia ruckeri]OIX39540.1 hypothetical protein AXW19_16420 [Yersinia ruckeri]OIX39654.1 hypothetical protein AXW20_16455 [Yersinia ruckeri]OIX39879.1 hypothetical protein AXW18_16455 [Yersinia ruckeri]OIX47198.1 hypothetical protein AXW22_16650 [Yersinia ruckeri]
MLSYRQRVIGYLLFFSQNLSLGVCEFIVNEHKREIAKLKFVYPVIKMSEFALYVDVRALGKCDQTSAFFFFCCNYVITPFQWLVYFQHLLIVATGKLRETAVCTGMLLDRRRLATYNRFNQAASLFTEAR